nr:MAG TPA: hypothetical protein [Caudoviricetes sp.]
MNKTINGVEFYSRKNDRRALAAYRSPEGAETLEDAKRLAEKLLASYVQKEPGNEYWSIEIESKDGHLVELSWQFEGDSDCGDEFIKTYIDGKRLYDQKYADKMRDAYMIGDAKNLLASTTVEEWNGIGIEWFNEHVAYVANYFEDDFTQEQHEEVKRISDILK